MNASAVIGFGFIFVGLLGIFFVLRVVAIDKFYNRYYVHWEDKDGNQFYSIMQAYSKNGAARKTYKSNPAVCEIGKIVRE